VEVIRDLCINQELKEHTLPSFHDELTGKKSTKRGRSQSQKKQGTLQGESLKKERKSASRARECSCGLARSVGKSSAHTKRSEKSKKCKEQKRCLTRKHSEASGVKYGNKR